MFCSEVFTSAVLRGRSSAHYVHRAAAGMGNLQIVYDVTAAPDRIILQIEPEGGPQCLRICRVRSSVRTRIAPKHYTLIDLATSIRAVATQLRADPSRCEIMMLASNARVDLPSPARPQPEVVQMFVDVYTDGTQRNQIEIKITLETVAGHRSVVGSDELPGRPEDLKERIKALSRSTGFEAQKPRRR